MDSILTEVKKGLGITPEVSAFDTDILNAIATSFTTLHQLGIEEASDTSIDCKTSTWDDVFDGNPSINYIRTYTLLNTRLIFDPPANSFAVESLKKTINELEWRITVNKE